MGCPSAPSPIRIMQASSANFARNHTEWSSQPIAPWENADARTPGSFAHSHSSRMSDSVARLTQTPLLTKAAHPRDAPRPSTSSLPRLHILLRVSLDASNSVNLFAIFAAEQ